MTPLRSLKVMVLPPSATSQLSASPGSTCVLPRANCVSLSYTGRAASKLVPVVLSAGVKFSGEPSEQ